MKHIISTSFLLLALFQYSLADEKLENCGKKLIEQIQNFNPLTLPTCIDDDQIQDIKQYYDTVKVIGDKLPEKCKTVTMDNLQECIKIIRDTVDEQSDTIKQIIEQGFQTSSSTISKCFKQFADKMSNLDKYVLNGCE